MKALSTVLLTGSRGFTGRHVRVALERSGYKVVGLVRGDAGEGEILADVADWQSVAAAVRQVHPSFVMHLAGIASVREQDALEFQRVNVLGTTALLEGIAQSGVRPEKIVLASSASVYGNGAPGLLDEFSPMVPVNPYGTSKLAMERMAQTYEDHLPLVVARPFNYTGVGQDERFLIAKVVGHFRRREPSLRLGNLDVRREFNDVRMVAQAYVFLLQAPAGTTVNLCTGLSHRLLDVVERVSRLMGHKLQLEIDPLMVRANEVMVLAGSPERLGRLVGKLPAFTLEHTLEWMLSS